MLTGGLLHHHLRPPLLHLAESPSLLCRRSPLTRPPFPLTRYASTPSKRRLLQPTLRSIHCAKQEEQAGSDGEVVEWVNKAPHDPMVELDPVTVFRRIVAERRSIASASLAKARAKEEEANLALQTTSPPPFILGNEWPGKFAIALATALVLLAVAAALYFLRSRKRRYEATKLTSADAKDTLESSISGRRKLVKDTIKAPESVLTAMALGAASVSRPKGLVGSTHEHASNGNVVESQRAQGATDFCPIVNTVAVEDMKSDLHGKPTFKQVPYSSSIVEEFTPLKLENGGVDVTEGPWFGQGVNDTEMLEVEELESEKSALAELMEFESEKPEELGAEDVLIESQSLPLSNTALPYVVQLVTDFPVGEVEFEASVLTGAVDGEFYGEVVVVSDPPNQSNIQVLEFKFEESQIVGVLAESAMTAEKLEQIIEEDAITSLEAKGAADDTVCSEQNIVIGSSALDVFNGQFGEIDSESDGDNIKHHGGEQSFTPTHDDGVTSLEASDDKSGFEEVHVAEGNLVGLSSDSLSVEEQENITNLLSGVDQTLEGIVTELNDVYDGVTSSANALQMGQVAEDQGFANDIGKKSLTDSSLSFEELQVAEGNFVGLSSDFRSVEEPENITNLLSGVDQTLEGIETELNDVYDGVSSSANAFQMGQLEEGEGFVNDIGKESLTDNSVNLDPIDCQILDSMANYSPIDAAVQASEEDSREDGKKALEAAVPAIAIGVGTVGALFGVAGGLQVVGFAALASLISHDFFWAQSRESLWQDLNGITDRQKLVDFLAKRNIMRTDRENSSS